MRINNLIIAVTIMVFLGCIRGASAQSCEKGWVHRTGSTSCYKFVTNSRVTWKAALDACQSLGGYTVALETEEEIIWMLGYRSYHKAYQVQFWTGGYKLDGRWFWKVAHGDSLPITAADWASGQPDNYGGRQDCIRLIEFYQDSSKHFKFDDIGCETPYGYICEKEML